MNNKRIILADPELHYIIKLQIKFLQELQDSYEVDVISDRDYFAEFFSAPQDAECLIINDSWATSILSKHNIDHVVILTDGTASIMEPTVRTRIPRYSSTEEIFNQIRSLLGAETNPGKKKDAAVLYFGSASGGTGKTVLAMSLAEHLAKRYYRVLYVNTQSSQSFQYYLQDRDTIPTEAANMILDESTDVYKTLKRQIREECFRYLAPFAMPLFSYGISHDIYAPFIGSARMSREYDYIIVDGGCDLNDETASLIALADKVIMVLNPGAGCNYALKLMLSKISIKDEKLITICNRVGLNPVRDIQGSDSLEISECVQEWKKEINADSIHEFSTADDIQKLAVLMG